MKHLIFDVDGTIWNSTEIVAGAWRRAIQETGYSKAVVTPERLQQEFGKPMDVIADNIFTDVPEPEKKAEILELCCKYEQQFLHEDPCNITYSGVVGGMRQLARENKLYIVSNCQKGYIELVMEKTGLGDCITDYDCFGNTGTCKGETILTVMRRNGLKPEECAYIGDTAGDEEAARYAGIAFIYAAYGFGKAEDPDIVIHDFTNLFEKTAYK